MLTSRCKQGKALFEKKEKFEEHVTKTHNSTIEVSHSWIGHMADIEPQPHTVNMAPEFNADQNLVQKVSRENTNLVDQWVE